MIRSYGVGRTSPNISEKNVQHQKMYVRHRDVLSVQCTLGIEFCNKCAYFIKINPIYNQTCKNNCSKCSHITDMWISKEHVKKITPCGTSDTTLFFHR